MTGSVVKFGLAGVALAALAGVCRGQVVMNTPGAKAQGAFGLAIAGVPDVNGDGKGDIIVGARGEGPGAWQEGHAYIYSGGTGALLHILLSPHPEPDGEFGKSVAGIPDLDGDGRGDVIVGAPEEDPDAAPNDAGRAYVFSGATGQRLFELGSPTPEIDGEFGGAVAGIPDLNGDGLGDFAIGAPCTDPGLTPDDAGRVYIYSGATGQMIKVLGSPFPVVNGRFGSSLAGMTDTNGDGRGDLLIGGPNETAAGVPTAGMVHLYSGAGGTRRFSVVSPGREAGGRFGRAIAMVPDANGDGRADILVGAPLEDPGASPTDNGRAYLYSGLNGVLLWRFIPPVPEAGAQFGVSVAGLADVNGDGRGDIAIGAMNENPGGSLADSGRVHVYSGATGARLLTLIPPAPVAGGQFGAAVAGVADTNANGRGDIAVGAPGEGSPATAGKAYLFRR